MKIKRNNMFNRPITIVLLVLLFCPLVYLTYLYFFRSSNSNVNGSERAKLVSSDKSQTDELRVDYISKTIAPNADKPASPNDGGEGQGKKVVQMTASTDSSDGNIYFRGGVNYPVTGGSCYVILKGPSGKVIQKNTTILTSPASTDCKTIIFPVEELDKGRWSFRLYYASDAYEGVSSEVTFSN